MLNAIIRWILLALALILVAKIVPGVNIADFWAALWAIAIIGIVNIFLKPILLILTLPINLITLGLFTFIINAGLFALSAFFVPGFEVEGFFPALLGSLFFSLFSLIINAIAKK